MKKLCASLRELGFSGVDVPLRSDWEKLQKSLGVVFPDDYKDVVGICGSGVFGLDLFLFNPCGIRKFLLDATALENYKNCFEGEDIGFDLWPKKGGAIRVGSTSAQIDVLIKQEGDRFLTIIWDFGIFEYKFYEMSISELLWKIYCGNDVCDELMARLKELTWPGSAVPLFVPASKSTGFSPLDADGEVFVTVKRGKILSEAYKGVLEGLENADNAIADARVGKAKRKGRS